MSLRRRSGNLVIIFTFVASLSERRRYRYCDARRPSVALCVCLSVHRAATARHARRISVGGEGNELICALYPVLSSLLLLLLSSLLLLLTDSSDALSKR